MGRCDPRLVLHLAINLDLQVLDWASNVQNMRAPLNASRYSAICRVGYASSTAKAFGVLYLVQQYSDPSFFVPNSISDVQFDYAGPMALMRSILSIYDFSNFRSLGPVQQKARLMLRGYCDIRSMCCLDMSFWPKGLLHICWNSASLTRISWRYLGYDTQMSTLSRQSVRKALPSMVLNSLCLPIWSFCQFSLCNV